MITEFFKGQREPKLSVTLRIGGDPQNLSGSAVTFRMRAEDVETPLKVDALASVVTAATTLSGQHELPESVLEVASTADFLEEGALLVDDQLVEYAAKSDTAFLGCTKGVGTIANGAAVEQIGGVRYSWVALDVDTAGDFRGWFVIDPAAAEPTQTPEFPISIIEHAPGVRSLCSLVDVLRYVPGYESEPTVDVLLHELIAAESRSIHKTTDREFVAIAAAGTRLFEISMQNVRKGRVRIGDCADVDTVRILDVDGTSELETVSASGYHLLPRTREEWEPITRLHFVPSSHGGPTALQPCRFLEVTGTWGFPQIPADLRQACARMVIVRCVGNPAFDGTRFADAIAETDIPIGTYLASANQVIRSYSEGPFA